MLLVTDRDVDVAGLRARLVLHFRRERGESSVRTMLAADEFRLPLYAGATPVSGHGEPIAFAANGSPLGISRRSVSGTTIVFGYDLLEELSYLLGEGQPQEEAASPTLDLHLDLLRRWIVGAGVPLVEILPKPWGYGYIVCLTHDIDFFGIRRHGLDHTVLGFAYRASVGTLRDVLRGRRTWRQLRRNLAALAKLPLVHLGLARDFWQPFDDYRFADGELPSTYFVVPFRDRVGARVSTKRANLRATRYDVRDVAKHLPDVERRGSEVAVHGIDAWHSTTMGRAEYDAVASAVGRAEPRRTHALALLRAADACDSRGSRFRLGRHVRLQRRGRLSCRNDAGFAPPGATHLLEVPLHAQDTALFLPRRLNLSESAAWETCARLRDHVRSHGGVLTITWHDRSLAPERLWDSFYRRLLEGLRADGAWFIYRLRRLLGGLALCAQQVSLGSRLRPTAS